jgi:hypothetical protein
MTKDLAIAICPCSVCPADAGQVCLIGAGPMSIGWPGCHEEQYQVALM